MVNAANPKWSIRQIHYYGQSGKSKMVNLANPLFITLNRVSLVLYGFIFMFKRMNCSDTTLHYLFGMHWIRWLGEGQFSIEMILKKLESVVCGFGNKRTIPWHFTSWAWHRLDKTCGGSIFYWIDIKSWICN